MQGLIACLLVLPWVHPWAPGPESNTVPLLVSWACAAGLMLLPRWPSVGELARAWACAAVLSSAIGLLQYFGQASVLSGWVHVPGFAGEAMGNLRQRNQLATLTSIGAVALLWWQAQGLRSVYAAGMLALLALGNAATASRTGLLQWLLLAALLGLWHLTARPRRAPWSWPLLWWALGVYLVACFALPWVLSAGLGVNMDNAIARMGASYGCGSRSVLWSNVLVLIGQHPWAGWGWGELKYAHYMAAYPAERFCEILGNAHNLPLHLAFVMGVPATLVGMVVVLALVLRARPWRLTDAGSSLGWGVMAMIGLHSLLEFPLWYGPFQLALIASVVVLWPAGQAMLKAWHARFRVLGIAGLCLLGVVAFDYLRVRQIYLPAADRLSIWRQDPWSAAEQTWFFGGAWRFAHVTSTPVTPENASAMLRSSQSLLHYSPEPRVIEQLVLSARLAGQEDLARWHEAQQSRVYGQPADPGTHAP